MRADASECVGMSADTYMLADMLDRSGSGFPFP